MTNGIPKKPSKQYLDLIKKTITYNPTTGLILRNSNQKCVVLTGKDVNYGVVTFKTLGVVRPFSASHIAWYLHYGFWTERRIFYKDKNPLNLAINNLLMREDADSVRISKKAYAHKRTSVFKGVYYHTANDLWVAIINKQNVRYYLGCFDSELDAAGAYNDKATELHGDFAVLNDLTGYGKKRGTR